jgi:hypothetical protein
MKEETRILNLGEQGTEDYHYMLQPDEKNFVSIGSMDISLPSVHSSVESSK